MDYIEYLNVSKYYNKNKTKIINNFTLKIKKKEFIVVLGPSGSGKTTLIRLLAGLEQISMGEIYLDGKLMNMVHPKDRDVAMVFQNYALYPHMSVYDNISFGLKIKHLKKNQINEKVLMAAELLEINDVLNYKPKSLSGGQRQRVALARALVRNPKVFVLDEPLSNLDAKLRVSTRQVITNLHKQIQATMIYVTHDQIEAMTMADKIVVIKNGEIQQIDSPKNLYQKPINLFVATFIGTPKMNIIDLSLLSQVEQEEIIKNHQISQVANILIGVRPHDVYLSPNGFKVVISEIEYLGNEYHLMLNYQQLKIQMVCAEGDFKINQSVRILFKNLHFFKKDEKTRIEK